MSGDIWVCPLSRLADVLRESGAGSVVTLSTAGAATVLPNLAGKRHLVVQVSDVASPRDGHVVPGRDHVEALLAFARAWDRRKPLLVHCYAGVSRSPAAALAIACALDPSRDERNVAAALRARAPSATPNPALVAAADAVLDRAGRLTEAVASIGRGRDCFEGEVFRIGVPGS